MLLSLKIKNYALFEEELILFKDGFTVICGETGSGKSIILDSISFLLGKRIERTTVSSSLNKKTIVEGVFIIDKSKANFFKANNLDYQRETIVRREISNKKSRAFINDTPVLLNILSEFRSKIIEIHSQNESNLLKKDNEKFYLIDKFAKNYKLLSDYKLCLEEYNALKDELSKLKNSSKLSLSELDFLQYQLNELDSAHLVSNEDEELNKKLLLLQNIEDIANIISEYQQKVNSDGGVVETLSYLQKKISQFSSLNNHVSRFDSLIIELNDIGSELVSYTNNINSNDNDLFEITKRLDLINNLLRKHNKNSIDELLEFKLELREKINKSKSLDEQVYKIEKKIGLHLDNLVLTSDRLNKSREDIIPSFSSSIKFHLSKLGIPHAEFDVKFVKLDDFHEFGNTQISFIFSANKGIQAKNINDVASGGELSRLMLVIKYLSVKYFNVPCLVFDEIDSGTSGEIASMIASMMKEVSNEVQLISISHQPQIAARADHHLKVFKSEDENHTKSHVSILNKNERILEIAKLLSGKTTSNEALENAKVLLSQ